MEEQNEFMAAVRKAIERYLPSAGRGEIDCRFIFDATGGHFEIPSIPMWTRVMAAFESLDYVAPLLLNAVAILMDFGVWGRAYVHLRWVLGL